MYKHSDSYFKYYKSHKKKTSSERSGETAEMLISVGNK